MNSIEWKITALATKVLPGPDDRQRLRRLLPAADKDRLIDTATREGLAGLFYKSFLHAGLLPDFSPRQQETLRFYYYSTVRCNLKLIRDAAEILERLHRQGIEVVLLQGMDLLHRLYDDVGLRPLTDIDLWVHESDRPLLTQILRQSGCRKDPLYPLTFRKGATVLDIHTHILWADRIRARALLMDQHQDQVFERCEPIVFEAVRTRCLDPYDRLIYLSLHLLKHRANRLIWLADIRNLAADWEAVDWNALLARARLLGQQKSIAQTFFLIGTLLGYRPPEEIRPKLAPLHPAEKRVLRLRREKGALPEWSTPLLFLSGRGAAKGAVFVFETMFPRPEVLRQVFPKTPGNRVFRLYALRLFQLVGKLKASLR